MQVSSIRWIPQLACLGVGYNIGVWSLVSLTSLIPQYTSAVLEDNPAPVISLCWQEPLDDPRHYRYEQVSLVICNPLILMFSYLWVMRGGGGKSLAYANMYSLSYRERRQDTVDGPRYDDLQSVTLSFEQMLTAEHDTDTMVSRVVSVDTLEMGLATGGDKVMRH